MGSTYRTRAQWNESSRPSGVFRRPSITTAPERPSTVGFALPSDCELPEIARADAERITTLGQMLPSSQRVLNAIVLHGDAAPDLLVALLRRVAVRGTWAAESSGSAPAIFVVGDLQPNVARLVAMARAFVHPPDGDHRGALQYMAQEASGAAVLHAEHDAESQVIWARGSLGEWIGASYPELHPRQREVLALTLLGLGRHEVAAALALTIHTVDYHLGMIRTSSGNSAEDLVLTLRPALAATPYRHISIRAPIPERPSTVDRSTPHLGLPIPDPTKR